MRFSFGCLGAVLLALTVTVNLNVSGIHVPYAATVTAAQGQEQEPETGVADRTRARDFDKRQLKESKRSSKSTISSKSSKSRPSTTVPTNAPTDDPPPQSRSFTGSYAGLDSEDGTRQILSLYCENGLCDVKLEDFSFTTCIEVTGNAYFGSLAIATGVPGDSLNDFDLALYCLVEG